MAVTSVIKLSDVGGHHRIDSEFYQPHYFIDFTKGKWEPIKKFLSLCQYGISQAMLEEPKGYPIFRMDDIKGCFLLNDEVKYIEIPQPIFKQFKLEYNDVLFNRVNAEEFVGRTGIFKLKGNYVFASYLIRLEIKPDSEILPDYLNIFLNCKFGKKQIRRFARRAVNQANVNAEELKNFKIALISLDIQRSVSRLSNKAWTKIELSKSLYSEAENLLLVEIGLKNFIPKYRLSYSTSLSYAFESHRIDAEFFQPAYEKVVDSIKKYKDGYTRLLDTVGSVKPNFNPLRFPEQIFNYIELADIDPSIGFINNRSEIIGEEAPSRARRILKENDVIVSSVEGSLEKAALIDKDNENTLASTGFFQFRTLKILPEVLLVLSKSVILQAQLKKECSGTILTAVPTGSLKRIIIPCIPDKTQQKIASLIQKSHAARKKADELLKIAKRAVEIAIENGDKESLEFISNFERKTS